MRCIYRLKSINQENANTQKHSIKLWNGPKIFTDLTSSTNIASSPTRACRDLADESNNSGCPKLLQKLQHHWVQRTKTIQLRFWCTGHFIYSYSVAVPISICWHNAPEHFNFLEAENIRNHIQSFLRIICVEVSIRVEPNICIKISSNHDLFICATCRQIKIPFDHRTSNGETDLRSPCHRQTVQVQQPISQYST